MQNQVDWQGVKRADSPEAKEDKINADHVLSEKMENLTISQAQNKSGLGRSNSCNRLF